MTNHNRPSLTRWVFSFDTGKSDFTHHAVGLARGFLLVVHGTKTGTSRYMVATQSTNEKSLLCIR